MSISLSGDTTAHYERQFCKDNFIVRIADARSFSCSAKNFVTANAIENILASPKKLKDPPPMATQVQSRPLSCRLALISDRGKGNKSTGCVAEGFELSVSLQRLRQSSNNLLRLSNRPQHRELACTVALRTTPEGKREEVHTFPSK